VTSQPRYRAINHVHAMACRGLGGGFGGALMRFVGSVALAAALCLPSGDAVRAAGAQTGVVLGDSQGEGVALASGLKNLARISVHIRGIKAVQQINMAPVGSTAFMVLGSNDAECCINGLDTSINAMMAAADQRHIRMVWVGPPCVRRSWNGRVRELDQMLARRFTGTSVTYVSMWDEKICSGVFHDRDGVHMTMKGYAYMWEKASAAAGFTFATGRPQAVETASVSENNSKPPRAAARTTARRKAHERHAHRVAKAAPTRAALPAVPDRQMSGGAGGGGGAGM